MGSPLQCVDHTPVRHRGIGLRDQLVRHPILPDRSRSDDQITHLDLRPQCAARPGADHGMDPGHEQLGETDAGTRRPHPMGDHRDTSLPVRPSVATISAVLPHLASTLEQTCRHRGPLGIPYHKRQWRHIIRMHPQHWQQPLHFRHNSPPLRNAQRSSETLRNHSIPEQLFVCHSPLQIAQRQDDI